MTVISKDTLGKVRLGEVLIFMRSHGQISLESDTIVSLVLSDGVRKATRGVLVAIQQRDKGFATVLTGKVGEDDSRDVGMTNEAIDKASTSVVQDDNSVGTLVGDVVDETISVVVSQAGSVPTLTSPSVTSNDASFGVGVDSRIPALKIPEHSSTLLASAVKKSVKGCTHGTSGTSTRATSSEQSTVGCDGRVRETQVTHEACVELSDVGTLSTDGPGRKHGV